MQFVSDTSGGQIALFIIVLSLVVLLGLLNLTWKKYFKKDKSRLASGIYQHQK